MFQSFLALSLHDPTPIAYLLVSKGPNLGTVISQSNLTGILGFEGCFTTETETANSALSNLRTTLTCYLKLVVLGPPKKAESHGRVRREIDSARDFFMHGSWNPGRKADAKVSRSAVGFKLSTRG